MHSIPRPGARAGRTAGPARLPYRGRPVPTSGVRAESAAPTQGRV